MTVAVAVARAVAVAVAVIFAVTVAVVVAVAVEVAVAVAIAHFWKPMILKSPIGFKYPNLLIKPIRITGFYHTGGSGSAAAAASVLQWRAAWRQRR